MNETRKIAEFIENVKYENLSGEVIEKAKACLLDYVGVTFFATQTSWGKIITEYCTGGNSGKAGIIPGSESKYHPAFAALANGTCAHGFELDDVSSLSISHPGAVVIPAAVALGEDRGVNGKKLIEAIVVGYDVMVRVGGTIASNHIAKGFHPTASFGVFGATAACCKILDLNADQIENALGVAGSFASGLMQFSVKGSMVKRIHAGKSAEQGVLIASLAEKGYTGPAEILEGEFGFCRVYRDSDSDINWSILTDRLGEEYLIMQTTVKPAPACGMLHSVIDNINKIREQTGFKKEDIDTIKVIGHNNLITGHNVYEPDSILAGQYSLPFTVGMAVVHDIEDPNLYLNDEILKDPTVLEYGHKIETEFDQEIQDIYPERLGSKMEITFKDGSKSSAVTLSPKGSVSNPYDFDGLIQRHEKLVKNILSKEQSDKIISNIRAVTEMDNIVGIFSIKSEVE